MQIARVSGVGMIPSWQFSLDPNKNPKINSHVQWPAGVYQTTPQPFTPYYQGPEGLGYSATREVKRLAGLGAMTTSDYLLWGAGLAGAAWLGFHFLGGKRSRRKRK